MTVLTDRFTESNRAGWASSYSDRVCPPRDTLERLRPHFPALGITRLARQTGLDTTGIPCFSAIRPNAKTLATSQGKGVDDDAAMTSAAMEAAEFAIAERELPVAWRGAAKALMAMEADWFDPRRMLPFGQSFDHEASIAWVAGRRLGSRRPVLVPRDAIRFDGEASELKGIAQSTNGLASGNTSEEAEFHGMCELIERDATTLWSLRPLAQQLATAVAPEAFGDPVVSELAQRVTESGLQLRLFDLTSDISVPTIFAVIGAEGAWRYFDLASGSGTHPVAARAAIRAITEAAQSRITAIAGARDDIVTAEYDDSPDTIAAGLLLASPEMPAPQGLALGASLGEARRFMLDAIEAAGVVEPAVVSMGGECFGISVVRIVSEELEDREANRHWRPGPRAITTLLEAA